MSRLLWIAFLLLLLLPMTSVAQPTEATLEEVLKTVGDRHVDSPDKAALYRGAIDGVLRGLDPWSSFLEPEDLDRLRSRLKGKYSGIGVEIAVRGGYLTIIAPLRGGPAFKAGIKAGDRVIRIGDHKGRGMTTRDSSRLLLGEPGTRVTITVETPGDKESRRTVELVRAKISIEPVTTTLQEVEGRRIVHARLVTFQRNTAQKLIEGLKAHRPVHGVVLDVRDNPGGLLSAAVRISAAFLARGPIVSTVGQSGKTLMTFKAEDAHEGHEWLRNPSLPVVVLINKGSASASEIVAGVLQDRGRAVLIGGQSFGKGSVQSIVKLTEGRALKLTTARYRLPSGRLIDGIGLVPDLRAEQDGELPLALEVIRSWARLRGVDPLEVPEG